MDQYTVVQAYPVNVPESKISNHVSSYILIVFFAISIIVFFVSLFLYSQSPDVSFFVWTLFILSSISVVITFILYTISIRTFHSSMDMVRWCPDWQANVYVSTPDGQSEYKETNVCNYPTYVTVPTPLDVQTYTM